MQSFVDELVSQSTQTGMIVNGKKTKEMLIGSVTKSPPALYCYWTILMRTGCSHLRCSAFTCAMIWTGHNTLMQSRLRVHRGCISGDNWNVPERLPAICCASTAQSSVQLLNMRVQSGTPAWPCMSQSDVLESLQSHERCFSWLQLGLYNGVNYRWCRHAPQSSWWTHSALARAERDILSSLRTLPPISETKTLWQNLEEADILRTEK